LALLAGALAIGLTESVLALILVFAAVWAIAAPAIEALDKRWRGKILREMEGAVDEIDNLIRDKEVAEEVDEVAEVAATDTTLPEPILDIPEDEEEETGASERERLRDRA